jgi:hypothetical protein
MIRKMPALDQGELALGRRLRTKLTPGKQTEQEQTDPAIGAGNDAPLIGERAATLRASQGKVAMSAHARYSAPDFACAFCITSVPPARRATASQSVSPKRSSVPSGRAAFEAGAG